MADQPWHKWVFMGSDEQARDSLEEFTDPTELSEGSGATELEGVDLTEPVAAISFEDAKRALGEDIAKPDLDELPTQKMSALSDEAAKILPPSGGRAARVFKNPSKPPPPRLELPLATAQHQAIVDPEPVAERSRIQRGPIAALVLSLAFALGGAAAWISRTPEVVSLPLEPVAPVIEAPGQVSQPAQPSAPAEIPETNPTPNENSAPPVEAAGPAPRPVRASPRREPTGAERAEALLDAAEGLRGNELRATLEAAAVADPGNPHAAAALAEFHMENDPHEALEWALTASQLRRRRAIYQDLVADAYERMGNLNDAAHARATADSLRDGDD